MKKAKQELDKNAIKLIAKDLLNSDMMEEFIMEEYEDKVGIWLSFSDNRKEREHLIKEVKKEMCSLIVQELITNE